MIKIAPSLLASDFTRLRDEIDSVRSADWLHFDVMDGHFVPNLSMGPPVLKAVRAATDMFLDVHLMIDAPERYVETFVDAGAEQITVHAEATTHLHRTLDHIRSLGVQAGVALNPATPVGVLDHVFHLVDLVLVMTVNPGYGGQQFLPETMEKLRTLRSLLKDREVGDIELQVDGGIDPDTAPIAIEAGATVLVAGTSIFSAADRPKAIQGLRDIEGRRA